MLHRGRNLPEARAIAQGALLHLPVRRHHVYGLAFWEAGDLGSRCPLPRCSALCPRRARRWRRRPFPLTVFYGLGPTCRFVTRGAKPCLLGLERAQASRRLGRSMDLLPAPAQRPAGPSLLVRWFDFPPAREPGIRAYSSLRPDESPSSMALTAAWVRSETPSLTRHAPGAA